jgi:hypothetical protein
MAEGQLSAAVENRVVPPGIAFNLAGIAVLVLLLAVGSAYLLDGIGRQNRTPVPTLSDGDRITQNLGGRELDIPAAWFRYGEQQREGFASQVDLTVMLKDDSGASYKVNVTLLPRSRARTSASLLDSVYLHQFADDTLEGVPGLIGKPMRQGDGFNDESVWYDPLSPNPFVAKCLPENGRSQCVRTVYLPSGIAAIYAFDAEGLSLWRSFDEQMGEWLGEIGAL